MTNRDSVFDDGQCAFHSAAGVRCHRAANHKGGHKPYPPEWDLPADLATALGSADLTDLWSRIDVDTEAVGRILLGETPDA